MRRSISQTLRIIAVGTLVLATGGAALADSARDAVLAGFTRLQKAKTFHADVLAQGRTIGIDVVAPDRYRFAMGPMQLIQIGTASYVNMMGGWKSFHVPGSGRMLGIVNSSRDYTAKSGSFTATDLGAKTVGAQALHAYQITDPKHANHPATVFLTPAGDVYQLSSAEERGTAVTVTFSRLNAPMSIVAPI